VSLGVSNAERGTVELADELKENIRECQPQYDSGQQQQRAKKVARAFEIRFSSILFRSFSCLSSKQDT